MVKATVVAILVVSALAVASARAGDVIAKFNGNPDATWWDVAQHAKPLGISHSNPRLIDVQKADRFVLTQHFREQQVVIDVDNALSAIERAKERISAAVESLRLAKTLEDGERFRFSLGATTTAAEVDEAARRILSVVKRLRRE